MKLSRKNISIAVVATLVLVVIAVILWVTMSFQPSLINAKAFKDIPSRTVSTIDTSHLGAGLLPPTNKWFSGIALQKIPKTVFPTPLAVSLTDTSFSVGMPTIVPAANTVTGGMAEKMTLVIDTAKNYKVTRYDELSVDVTYSDANDEKIGTLTITAGSPYVQFSADKQSSLRLVSTLGVGMTKNNSVTFASNKGSYVVSTFRDAKIDGATIDTKSKSLVTMYVSPTVSTDDALATHASRRIIGTQVTYKDEGKSYRTDFKIKTDDSKQTLYALLPHQTNGTASIFSYDTLYGKQRMYEGNAFTFTTPTVPVTDQLDVSKVDAADKALLVKSLISDNLSTKFTARDSYYSGKELYRTAQLLQIAEQLGEASNAGNLKSKLRAQLGLWFDDSKQLSFYYDKTMKSIVGDKASFGSENGNDHHFHYGYFIYASSILARYDKDFLKQNKPIVDLLVADIANYKTGEQLPLRRNFDPYFGHSWASGDPSSDDGNNQESSSEAINAWIATKLWADQTDNLTLRNQAEWMLSNEVSATSHYWMDIDTSQKPFSNVYKHSLVSLNWSGKREYGTFFSNEPTAKLGIQLIPMSPTQINISSANKNLAKHISEVAQSGYALPFGDYILMYNSQLSVGRRLELAKSLPDSAIDGANSRTYLYASLLSQE